jgi:2-polyprenyl-3-methyl-5-hydroxy-6-metoxy-1,4-benzoquinol methylase
MYRRREPEQIDQPDLDTQRHQAALRGLARINWWSATAATLGRELRRLAAGRPLRVLDVATGGGDVPVRLTRSGLPLELAGCDRSPTALAYAAQRAAALGAKVEFFTLDALHDPLPAGYDVLTCSLFLHHLDEPGAVELLRRLAAAAGRAVLVSDLSRSRTGLLLAHAAVRLLTRSPMVHADGPASVRAAWTPAEALRLAHDAGLTGATVRRSWPCRFLLMWEK